jgi:hypothetical protein
MAKKTKPQVEQTEVETVEIPKVKRLGIGKIIQDMILIDPERKNQDILDEIKSLYPQVNTSYSCVAWYRSNLRKNNLLPKREKKVETV